MSQNLASMKAAFCRCLLSCTSEGRLVALLEPSSSADAAAEGRLFTVNIGNCFV